MRTYQVCKNCVMNTSESRITFDEKGVWVHCNGFYKNVKQNWNAGVRGKKKLDDIV